MFFDLILNLLSSMFQNVTPATTILMFPGSKLLGAYCSH